MTRYGGTSRATSYETLWTLFAARSPSLTGGSVSSPAITMIRSYGSTAFNPGAGSSGASPSRGAQRTSSIVIGSRLFRGSDRRAFGTITPTIRPSAARPSNGIRRPPDATPGAAAPPAAGTTGGFLRFRKSNGTSLLRRAAVGPDQLHDAGVGEGRGVPECAALGDIAQEPAHDLPGPRLRQVGHEQQGLRFRDRADLRCDVRP